ncbi:hypothetical protein ACO0LB_06140 [Undibacterium sp. SXout7W]|uniref:hypothetical protein n=1 Tax=Undibacterium sp. SXout7W TaxID=3413049 RepID=UPI003BEFAA51
MKKFHEIKINPVQSSVLLDRAREMAGLKNDAALARALEVAPPVISKLRNGRLPVGASFVIRLHELTTLPISDIKAILCDEGAA